MLNIPNESLQDYVQHIGSLSTACKLHSSVDSEIQVILLSIINLLLDLFLTTFTRLMLCGRDPVKVVSQWDYLQY